jgi:uncharacterized protein (DUF433 family)
MRYKERIEITPEILVGKPITKGTPISVEFILELLANGWDTVETLKNYPQLRKENAIAAIEYSLETLKEKGFGK